MHSSYVITVEPSASIYPSKHLIAMPLSQHKRWRPEMLQSYPKLLELRKKPVVSKPQDLDPLQTPNPGQGSGGSASGDNASINPHIIEGEMSVLTSIPKQR